MGVVVVDRMTAVMAVTVRKGEEGQVAGGDGGQVSEGSEASHPKHGQISVVDPLQIWPQAKDEDVNSRAGP